VFFVLPDSFSNGHTGAMARQSRCTVGGGRDGPRWGLVCLLSIGDVKREAEL